MDEQVAPAAVEQLIPAGWLVTVPVPDPARDTVMPDPWVNVALAVAGPVIVSVQVPVPEQLPPHPVNKKPLAAVAVSVTSAPWAKFAEHVVGQLIPPELLVMVPVPAAGGVTVKVKVFVGGGVLALFPPPHAASSRVQATNADTNQKRTREPMARFYS